MKRHSFFAPLWLSWAPGDLYRDLARNGRGAGVLWLLFLTLANTGILTVKMVSAMSQIRTDWWPAVVKKMPDIKMTNGVFSTPDNQPVEIHNPTDKTVVAVLLPAETSVPAKYSDTLIVVLGDRVVVSLNSGKPVEVKFKPQMNGSLTNEELAAKSDVILSMLPWVAALAVLLAWFIARLINWLILSITAVGANGASGKIFSYAALLRITAAAETPTILINMILSAFGIEIPYVGGLFFAVTMVLIILAVRAAARTDVPPPFESDRSATPPVSSP